MSVSDFATHAADRTILVMLILGGVADMVHYPFTFENFVVNTLAALFAGILWALGDVAQKAGKP